MPLKVKVVLLVPVQTLELPLIVPPTAGATPFRPLGAGRALPRHGSAPWPPAHRRALAHRRLMDPLAHSRDRRTARCAGRGGTR